VNDNQSNHWIRNASVDTYQVVCVCVCVHGCAGALSGGSQDDTKQCSIRGNSSTRPTDNTLSSQHRRYQSHQPISFTASLYSFTTTTSTTFLLLRSTTPASLTSVPASWNIHGPPYWTLRALALLSGIR